MKGGRRKEGSCKEKTREEIKQEKILLGLGALPTHTHIAAKKRWHFQHSCFPERVAVVAEVIGITSAMGISMGSAMGMIIVRGTEELQEHLTWTGMSKHRTLES